LASQALEVDKDGWAKKTALQVPFGSFFLRARLHSVQDCTPASAVLEKHFKFLSSHRIFGPQYKKGRKESIKQTVMKIAQRP
jgi:hypothetical protein